MEGGDQLRGQLLDEADGICEERSAAAGQLNAPGGGIERGEELIRHEDLGIGQRVEQRGLARVGVADQCDGGHARSASTRTMALSMRADLLQLILQMRDAPPDHAAVGLQLRLAGAADADASRSSAGAPAGLAGQVGPGPRQTRQPVFVLGKLDLERSLPRMGVLGEDVEDQRGAIQQFDVVAEDLLELALVTGGELIVEEDDVGGQLVNPLPYLPRFPRSHKRGRMGMHERLHLIPDNDHARRVGQALKLCQRFLDGPVLIHPG